MARRAFLRKIAPALVLGAVLGVVLSHAGEPTYSFVQGVSPVFVQELPDTPAGRATLRVYNVRMDWRAMLERIRRDQGPTLLSGSPERGAPSETLVVPRIEKGRAQLFGQPLREITVVRGRFYREKSGREFIRPDRDWTGVRVTEYRPPRFLDTARDWLRTTLRV